MLTNYYLAKWDRWGAINIYSYSHRHNSSGPKPYEDFAFGQTKFEKDPVIYAYCDQNELNLHLFHRGLSRSIVTPNGITMNIQMKDLGSSFMLRNSPDFSVDRKIIDG